MLGPRLTLSPHFPLFQRILGQLGGPTWWLKPSEGTTASLDEERIEALSAADPIQLRFLGELLGSGYSEAVIVKWSMHPVLGPKLRSGEWLPSEAEGLPDIVKQAMAEARTGRPVMGFDYQLGLVSSSKPAAQAPERSSGPGGSAARLPGVPPKAGSGPKRVFWNRRPSPAKRPESEDGQ